MLWHLRTVWGKKYVCCPLFQNSNSALLLVFIFGLREILMLALKAGPFWSCKCTVSRRERLYNLDRKGRNGFEIADTLKRWSFQTEIVLTFSIGTMGLDHDLFFYKQTLKLFLWIFLFKLDFMTPFFVNINCHNNWRVINRMSRSSQTLYKTSAVPMKLCELKLPSLLDVWLMEKQTSQ